MDWEEGPGTTFEPTGTYKENEKKMAFLVRPEWLRNKKEEIEQYRSIDITSTFNKAIQAIIIILMENNLPFKLYNLGAGVKRITTKTDICPCCKKKLS